MIDEYTNENLNKLSNEKLIEVMESKFLDAGLLSKGEMIEQILNKQQDQIDWYEKFMQQLTIKKV